MLPPPPQNHFPRPLEADGTGGAQICRTPPPPPPPYHFPRPLEADGTGGAQKCRGSGAPNLNQHPNHPLCHAVCAAAIFFEIVAKFCTMATNLLKFFIIGSDGVAFIVGALGVDCAVEEGRILIWSVEGATGSGHLVAWVMGFWGSSPASFPLLSSLNKGRISSSFFHGPYTIPNCGASSSSSGGSSTDSTFNSS